jgi:MYXO-CTERM domain-containing protein
MTTKLKTLAAASLAAIGALGASMSASASSVDYTYRFENHPDRIGVYDSGDNKIGQYDRYGNGDSGAAPMMEVSAWYGSTYNGVAAADDKILDEAWWEIYSGGVGISNSNNDYHTIDNNGAPTGKIDYLALDFGTAVSLAEVEIGYVEWCADSDFTVLYSETYQNNSAGFKVDASNDFNPDGNTYDDISLTAGAFKVATHVDGQATNPNTARTYDVSSTFTSAVWLIAAYNPNLGGDPLASGGAFNGDNCNHNCPDDDDKFKVQSVSIGGRDHPPGEVPVPATLALMGVGGLLLRRRQNG